jgi:hypothetical protein
VLLPQLRRIRWAVRATLLLGVAASVLANILHALDNPISQAIAAWPPVALLLTVELISRVPVGRRLLAATRLIATAIIAGIAAWVSYWHMAGVAARYGETGASPYLLPLSVDGLIVVASICLVELAGRILSLEQSARTATPLPSQAAAPTSLPSQAAAPTSLPSRAAAPTPPASQHADTQHADTQHADTQFASAASQPAADPDPDLQPTAAWADTSAAAVREPQAGWSATTLPTPQVDRSDAAALAPQADRSATTLLAPQAGRSGAAGLAPRADRSATTLPAPQAGRSGAAGLAPQAGDEVSHIMVDALPEEPARVHAPDPGLIRAAAARTGANPVVTARAGSAAAGSTAAGSAAAGSTAAGPAPTPGAEMPSPLRRSTAAALAEAATALPRSTTGFNPTVTRGTGNAQHLGRTAGPTGHTGASRPTPAQRRADSSAKNAPASSRSRRTPAETVALAARIMADRPTITEAELAAELGISLSRWRTVRREVADRDLAA